MLEQLHNETVDVVNNASTVHDVEGRREADPTRPALIAVVAKVLWLRVAHDSMIFLSTASALKTSHESASWSSFNAASMALRRAVTSATESESGKPALAALSAC